VSFHRGIDGSDPVRAQPVAGHAGPQEERRRTRSWLLGSGTLACPRCDAPVALDGGRIAPSAPLGCPFCAHHGAVRDFLTLGEPTRPAHVVVRVLAP
jgi:hypothetical protein